MAASSSADSGADSEPPDGETAAAGDEADGEPLRARVWPRILGGDGTDSVADEAPVQITVYVVTGRQGWLRIPESFCRECHRFVRAADAAAERADAPVDVRVVSWYSHLPWALRHGGYHPPVMVVGGKRLAQAYDVPTPERVLEAIHTAAREG